ncbi:MAG: DmsE family decaheme c-type cytochrome [Gammaproteobacteria bacterium]|nr:DmsE family decaheme c-type cytochrome [Gammaproteobacteria bacterium]
MIYKHKLPILLVFVLLFTSQGINAAETSVSSEAATEDTTAKEKTAVETNPVDTTEAGKAEHAFKQANLCEGMAEGDYLESDVCADCHQDKIETMLASPHGQVNDPRSPFGREGCETCHGPGAIHFENEGNCIISMTGRFGESVEQRNDICLDCHQGGGRMHWLSSTHEAEDLACVSCHSIHQPNDVIDRTLQAEVCYICHKDIRSQTFRASSHPIRENRVICSDCHNQHGSAGPSSLKQLSINENCYSCHAEKRGPFLWEHYPASEDCILCHRVHGSNHYALLNEQGPQLCQQCHDDITGSGSMHIRNFLDSSESILGHTQFKVEINCANCHSKIHGSNHPSGAALQR